MFPKPRKGKNYLSSLPNFEYFSWAGFEQNYIGLFFRFQSIKPDIFRTETPTLCRGIYIGKDPLSSGSWSILECFQFVGSLGQRAGRVVPALCECPGAGGSGSREEFPVPGATKESERRGPLPQSLPQYAGDNGGLPSPGSLEVGRCPNRNINSGCGHRPEPYQGYPLCRCRPKRQSFQDGGLYSG